MKRNILIAIIILLAAVLLLEIGYIIYRGDSAQQEAAGETTGKPEQTTGEVPPVDTTQMNPSDTSAAQTDPANTDAAQGTTGDEEELPPVTNPQQSGEDKKPTGSTGSKPTEGTKPAESSKPTEGTKPTESSKPTEGTKPAETTKPTEATKPAETEPEETTEATRDTGLDENELPPMPI